MWHKAVGTIYTTIWINISMNSTIWISINSYEYVLPVNSKCIHRLNNAIVQGLQWSGVESDNGFRRLACSRLLCHLHCYRNCNADAEGRESPQNRREHSRRVTRLPVPAFIKPCRGLSSVQLQRIADVWDGASLQSMQGSRETSDAISKSLS